MTATATATATTVATDTATVTTTDATETVVNINPVKVRKTGKVGRPSFMIKIPSNKSFTVKDLEKANPNVKSVTIRAHVIRALSTGKITKLVKTVKTGKKGKPANRFLNTNRLNAMKAKDLVGV
jgi:hypothetical protein